MAREIESEKEAFKTCDTERRQLEREKALLQHKQNEWQRKADMESEKRRKVKPTLKIRTAINIELKPFYIRLKLTLLSNNPYPIGELVLNRITVKLGY